MSVDFKEKYRSLRASKLFEADLSILEVMLKDFEKQVNHFSKLVKKDKINADRFKQRKGQKEISQITSANNG